MADYPLAVTSFPTLVDYVDSVLASHQNARAGEIVAIETELGTNPSGNLATLKARLAVSMDDNGYIALPYGSMYGDNIAKSVTIASAGVYYEVNGSISSGTTSSIFTFQNSKELKCNVAGKFLVIWSMSISSGNNKHIEGGVMVNSTAIIPPKSAGHTPGIGDQIAVGSTAILTLAVNDLVKFCVENETDTTAIVVEQASMTLIYLGA